MRVYQLFTQPVSFGDPKIWMMDHCLYAETSSLVHLLSFFAYRKTVKADRIKKHIEISTTRFWFKKSKEYVSFADIEYIDVSERSIINNPGWSKDGIETGFGGREPTKIHHVQVRSKRSPYPINLVRFIDDGRNDYGGLGIFIGDSQTDTPSPGQKKALAYAKRLSAFTGATLWNDRLVQFNFDQGPSKKCPGCGHLISLNAIVCMYCGKSIRNKR